MAEKVKTIRDFDFEGKTALVRCDFNVPLDAEGNITDDRRIEGALPTIRYLTEHGAKVILMSHLGRPNGEAKAEFSLAPVACDLAKKLGLPRKICQTLHRLRGYDSNRHVRLMRFDFHPTSTGWAISGVDI